MLEFMNGTTFLPGKMQFAQQFIGRIQDHIAQNPLRVVVMGASFGFYNFTINDQDDRVAHNGKLFQNPDGDSIDLISLRIQKKDQNFLP